jgi:hypothetical protein
MPTKNLFNPKNLLKFLSTQHVVVLDTQTLYELYYFLYYEMYNLYVMSRSIPWVPMLSAG